MKTFTVHPFEQVVGVTTDIGEFLKHDESYMGILLKEGITDVCFMQAEEKDVRNCQGMSSYYQYGKKPFVKFVVYIRPDNTKDASLRFHESLHVTHQIMEHCGQPIDYESTEIQAYTMEYVSRNIEEALNKKK